RQQLDLLASELLTGDEGHGVHLLPDVGSDVCRMLTSSMEPGARHRTVARDATVPLRYRDRPAAVPLPRRHRGADRGVTLSAHRRDPGLDHASPPRVWM